MKNSQRGLDRAVGGIVQRAYLGDHHMAIKGTDTACCSRSLNMRTDLGDDRGAKSHIWNKVAVHLTGISVPLAQLERALEYDVNMKP